jgi:hypothetical protein
MTGVDRTDDRTVADDDEEVSPGSGVIEGVQAGAAPVYNSGAVKISDRGVVSLEPASMPQYQLALNAGMDPVIPEDHEELLELDPDTRAARYHRAARAEAEADMDSAETSEEQQIALAEGSSRTTGTEPQGASTGQDTATGQSGVGQADSQDKTNDESGPTARRRRNS